MIGERIRILRESLGLTRQSFAKKLKVSDSTINKIERGERNPSYELFVDISKLGNVTADYLLGLSNEKTATLDKDSIPKELTDIGVEFLTIAKELRDSGIASEDIKKIVSAIKNIKNKGD